MANRCPKCGREIEDNAGFCGYCGTKLVQNAHRTAPQNNNKKQIGIVVIVLLVVALVFGGVFIHNRSNTMEVNETTLRNSADDKDYSLYYPVSKYQEYYKYNEDKKDNASVYDSKDRDKIDDEIDNFSSSDYDHESVTSNITLYKGYYTYFDTIISVGSSEKNQKYRRDYLYKDGKLLCARIFDNDEDNDAYRYYYSSKILYYYISPDEEYNFSKMIPTKWGYFAYQESQDLYKKYGNKEINDRDDDYDYEDDDDDYDDDSSDYIFPNSDSEYLTRSEVEELSQKDNRLAINEIYARHGYTYETEDLKEYFESKDWYESDPDINQSTWNDNMLNDYERANINLLATVAKEKGYR